MLKHLKSANPQNKTWLTFNQGVETVIEYRSSSMQGEKEGAYMIVPQGSHDHPGCFWLELYFSLSLF